MSLKRNTGREDEFRVSVGSEFQSPGPMTEKTVLPSDDRTYIEWKEQVNQKFE